MRSRMTVERATIAFHTAFHPCFGYTWNLMLLPSVWSSNFSGSYPVTCCVVGAAFSL
jgi:hypothetical protein